MNSHDDDIFDLDFDPDVLIHLLGKLSLDNIPSDLSDALSSLENRNDQNTVVHVSEVQNGTLDISNSSSVKENEGNMPAEVSTSSSEEENKNSFFSSIGLISGCNKTSNKTKGKRNVSSFEYNTSEKHTVSLGNIKSDPKKNQNFSSVSQIKSSSRTRQDKPGKSSNSNSDSTDFNWQGAPFSSDFFMGKSFNSFHELRQQGKVFDIQLNDIDSIKFDLQRLPFLPSDEISNDNSEKSFQSDITFIHECDSNDSSQNSLPISKVNFDLPDKCTNSQDSGYDTSSTVSPSPPFINTETFSSLEFYEEADNDDIDNIVATIVEVENSIVLLETIPSSVIVPVLKDAKNPEDHKKKILDFLKEPLSVVSAKSASASSSDTNSSPLEKVNHESIYSKEWNSPDLVSSKRSPHSSRKSPLKAKDRKLGYELKHASKNDLGHIVISTKRKHGFESSKILKLIQDDERTEKKIKFIHLIDKKMKRTAADELENKKKRRLLSSKEEIFTAKLLI